PPRRRRMFTDASDVLREEESSDELARILVCARASRQGSLDMRRFGARESCNRGAESATPADAPPTYRSPRGRHDCTEPRSAPEPGALSASRAEAGESRRDPGRDHRPAAESTLAGDTSRQAAARLIDAGVAPGVRCLIRP